MAEIVKHLHIIKSSIYNHVANIINRLPNVINVLDMGGTGRLKKYLKASLTDANLKKGIDGSNLPYKDNQFSVSMSTATFEHVQRKQAFMDEAFRVASICTVHWFPAGEPVAKAEKLRIGLGLNPHPCVCPTLEQIHEYCRGRDYTLYPYRTISEHFLLLATISPKADNDAVSEFCSTKLAQSPYAYVLMMMKE